jgi:hypothetical protein
MMKKFLVLGLLATSVSAQDVKFGDLNYFLKAGELNLRSDFDLVREETKLNQNRYEVEGYLSRNRLAWGLGYDVVAYVGLNFIYQMDTRVLGEGSSQNSGLLNPVLGADYRLMDQKSGFNLDLGVVADFNVIDSEVADDYKDNGNQTRSDFSHFGDPRSSLGVNARLGRKWNEANEWYALGGVSYNFAGEQRVQNTDVELGESVDFVLGGFYQYRPVNEFMMTLGAVGTRYGVIDTKNVGETTSFVDVELSFNAKYLVTDAFIVKFNFTQDRRGEFKIKDKSEYDSRRGNSFGMGIDLLF